MSLRAALVVPLVSILFACAGGCAAAPTDRWVERRFEPLTMGAMFNLVLVSIDAEGFVPRLRNPDTGEIESDWVIGLSNRVLRGPTRRRVHAVVQAHPEGGQLVRLRVATQVIRKGGLLAVNVRDSDDWESVPDDVDMGELLLAKIAALVRTTESAPVP